MHDSTNNDADDDVFKLNVWRGGGGFNALIQKEKSVLGPKTVPECKIFSCLGVQRRIRPEPRVKHIHLNSKF